MYHWTLEASWSSCIHCIGFNGIYWPDLGGNILLTHLQYRVLWAENYFIVATGRARIHLTGGVVGVGDRFGTGSIERFSSTSGSGSRAVHVETTVARCGCERVGRCAEAGNVVDCAARSSALQS